MVEIMNKVFVEGLNHNVDLESEKIEVLKDEYKYYQRGGEVVIYEGMHKVPPIFYKLKAVTIYKYEEYWRRYKYIKHEFGFNSQENYSRFYEITEEEALKEIEKW